MTAPKIPKMIKLLLELEDLPARVEYMVWTVGEHNPAPSGIEDDLDTDGDLIEKAFGIKSDEYYEKEEGGGYRSRQEHQLWDHLCYKFTGWTIVKCSTPVFERREGSTIRSFSWGHYTSSYFAAKKPEDALQAAFDWAKKEGETVKIRPSKKKKQQTAKEA